MQAPDGVTHDHSDYSIPESSGHAAHCARHVSCIVHQFHPGATRQKQFPCRVQNVVTDDNMVRVIDEDKSESDGYLYEASMFTRIELPEIARRTLMAQGKFLNRSENPGTG